MTAKYPTCRVLSGKGVQCTGEAVSASAELLICTRHLAEAMRLIGDMKSIIATGRGASGDA